MKVKIICVGRLKEKYLVAGIAEYLKRLQAYCKVEVYEVSDESIPDYVVLLDVAGKEIDSIMLAKQMENCMISGKSTIDFVIGGSLGHGQEIIERANFRLSFSKMTFPHQLMRLILVEQIYRAFKIMKNESYHK